ncbi:hypothetical protein QBC40DRAFT_291687 [Triangularia verruculosa]|uniref:Uncharacterized protein n=1 Tax=Triangularia verruculosa TaxID=2587418 RepID=A0AAN7B0E6_9PEZI|nr:hypothetical protein QBC40DRAFT_291687 [Triangularia verruculosa]
MFNGLVFRRDWGDVMFKRKPSELWEDRSLASAAEKISSVRERLRTLQFPKVSQLLFFQMGGEVGSRSESISKMRRSASRRIGVVVSLFRKSASMQFQSGSCILAIYNMSFRRNRCGWVQDYIGEDAIRRVGGLGESMGLEGSWGVVWDGIVVFGEDGPSWVLAINNPVGAGSRFEQWESMRLWKKAAPNGSRRLKDNAGDDTGSQRGGICLSGIGMSSCLPRVTLDEEPKDYSHEFGLLRELNNSINQPMGNERLRSCYQGTPYRLAASVESVDFSIDATRRARSLAASTAASSAQLMNWHAALYDGAGYVNDAPPAATWATAKKAREHALQTASSVLRPFKLFRFPSVCMRCCCACLYPFYQKQAL